jgi:hypothetical protein
VVSVQKVFDWAELKTDYGQLKTALTVQKQRRGCERMPGTVALAVIRD